MLDGMGEEVLIGGIWDVGGGIGVAVAGSGVAVMPTTRAVGLSCKAGSVAGRLISCVSGVGELRQSLGTITMPITAKLMITRMSAPATASPIQGKVPLDFGWLASCGGCCGLSIRSLAGSAPSENVTRSGTVKADMPTAEQAASSKSFVDAYRSSARLDKALSTTWTISSGMEGLIQRGSVGGK